MEKTKRTQRRGNPFFANLPSFESFQQVSDFSTYTPVPDTWIILITDIEGSTTAISEGRYKEVNMIGAASISAVLNVTRVDEVPYAFGGDGATFIVPAETLPRVRQALLKTHNLARHRFNLTLRVGYVPVAHVRARGVDVLVGKFRLSKGNYLAMFAGGGVSLADRMIKDDDGSQGYQLNDALSDENPDLEGLSCRWEPLASRRGIILSVLAQARDHSGQNPSDIYKTVLSRLLAVLEPEITRHRPVQAENMVFRWPPRGLRSEALATMGDGSYLGRLLALYWESFLQLLLENFNLHGGGYNAPVYRQELRENSDYRRFDDTLRMVLDCTPEEVASLEAVLVNLHEQGLVAFGLHKTDRALMTCLVFSLADSEHVHFIDGADGGYAMAARQLKQQLADVRSPEQPLAD